MYSNITSRPSAGKTTQVLNFIVLELMWLLAIHILYTSCYPQYLVIKDLYLLHIVFLFLINQILTNLNQDSSALYKTPCANLSVNSCTLQVRTDSFHLQLLLYHTSFNLSSLSCNFLYSFISFSMIKSISLIAILRLALTSAFISFSQATHLNLSCVGLHSFLSSVK